MDELQREACESSEKDRYCNYIALKPVISPPRRRQCHCRRTPPKAARRTDINAFDHEF